MYKPRAPQILIVRETVGALGELTYKGGRKTSRGGERRTAVQTLSRDLREDEVLVVIARKEGALVESITLPLHRTVQLRDVGLRLAGIELAIEDLLARPQAPSMEGGLSDAERALLTEGGFDAEPSPGEPLPMDRGALEYDSLLRESYDPEEAAKILQVNTSRIRQRLGRQRTLFGIKDGRGWRLPKFQFARRRLVPGIGQVFAGLPPDMHPVAVYRWFVTPHPDLVVESTDQTISPLDWLRQGNAPDLVAALAAQL